MARDPRPRLPRARPTPLHGAAAGSSGPRRRDYSHGVRESLTLPVSRAARLIGPHYPEVKFGGFTDVDGTIAFYTRVNALIGASSTVLDVGCGDGAYATDPVAIRRTVRVLKGRCRRVIGIDVDK